MRNCIHLLKAMNTSITSTMDAFLSRRSMVVESFASLSPSPAIASGSSLSFTCSMSLSMVCSSLFTSSGRVMLDAARCSCQPFSATHLLIVTADTPTFSAMTFCVSPCMKSRRAYSFFSSNSFFVAIHKLNIKPAPKRGFCSCKSGTIGRWQEKDMQSFTLFLSVHGER